MTYKCKHDESRGLNGRYLLLPIPDRLLGFWSIAESKVVYPCVSRPDLVNERNLALSVHA